LAPFAFAGLYEDEADRRRGVIVTTQANTVVGEIHNRMPVMLDDAFAWLDEAKPDALKALCAPFPDALMESFSVNPVVNTADCEGPQCIEPFEPPQLSLF